MAKSRPNTYWARVSAATTMTATAIAERRLVAPSARANHSPAPRSTKSAAVFGFIVSKDGPALLSHSMPKAQPPRTSTPRRATATLEALDRRRIHAATAGSMLGTLRRVAAEPSMPRTPPLQRSSQPRRWNGAPAPIGQAVAISAEGSRPARWFLLDVCPSHGHGEYLVQLPAPFRHCSSHASVGCARYASSAVRRRKGRAPGAGSAIFAAVLSPSQLSARQPLLHPLQQAPAAAGELASSAAAGCSSALTVST